MAAPRILHFIESEGVYGAEQVILNLCEQMLAGERYQPVIGCIVSHLEQRSDLYDAAISKGIEAIKIPIANSKLPLHIPLAAKQLRRSKINLIHSHGYKPSVFGFPIRLITKIPVISTCHLWFDPKRAPLKARVMIRLEKLFYRWYPKIIGVSEPILQVLRQAGLPEKKLALIKNGVNLPPIPDFATRQNLRASLGLAPDCFCILNTARLTRQKGQQHLIDAACVLKKEAIDFRILIVGEGPLHNDLRTQIEENSLQSEVLLLGFRKDVPELLAAADVFALPSLDEGMPMSLLEAAASKTPIVTTLVGDIRKLVKHKETGLAVSVGSSKELAEALLSLHCNPALGRALAHAAYEIMLSDYSSNAMYRQYEVIYDQVALRS